MSPPISRREAIATAAAIGAALAWPTERARGSRVPWQEWRDLFPQGVASGDPQPDGVILWTRRPPVGGAVAKTLTIEIASDDGFRRVVSTAHASVDASFDWTCRVLVSGLAPARIYWYRSRTITASAAGWAARSRRPRPTTRAPSASPS